MCMSTASVESTVREGFHASKRNVHTILVLWKIHHRCMCDSMLKPLHTLQSFEFSGDEGIAKFCTQSLDFNPFHSCGDAAQTVTVPAASADA